MAAVVACAVRKIDSSLLFLRLAMALSSAVTSLHLAVTALAQLREYSSMFSPTFLSTKHLSDASHFGSPLHAMVPTSNIRYLTTSDPDTLLQSFFSLFPFPSLMFDELRTRVSFFLCRS